MSQLKLSSLANQAGTEETPIADVLHGSARAWVNFNGTGTVAIRASYNVSSITDNGTGDYTVNFTTAMVDALYSCTATCSGGLAGGQGRNGGTFDGGSTTSSVRILVHQISTVSTPLVDNANIQVAIFR